MIKKGQFNFVWLFAIIVGGIILYLSVYGALKTAETQKYKTDTEIAKSLSILTDPLQAGFAKSSYGSITLEEKAKINNFCFEPVNDFGRNEISVFMSTKLNANFENSGAKIPIYNKYIFSNENLLGEKFYVFSSGFYLPFKVSDMIFLIEKNYCFYNSPPPVEEEISNLGIPNIEIAKSSSCSLENPVNVCFDGEGPSCDIKVFGCYENCDSFSNKGIVLKEGTSIDFIGNLVYAAIFSNKNNYECNVKRLLYRAKKISEVFSDKSDLMSSRGCNSNIKLDLEIFKNNLENASLDDLEGLSTLAKSLEEKNNRELCKTW